MLNCIFCKIRDRIIPKEFTYEDRDLMVFPDIHPLRRVHLLIIPKKHIKELLDLKDDRLLGKIRGALQILIKQEKLNDKGYRIVINGGGAQAVEHLHIHLMGPVGLTAKM